MTQFTHSTQDMAPTQYLEGGGIRFAYRRFGISGNRRSRVPERFPLVFFQHFMGTLDDHDPALSDAFASDREVILFNNVGVASSSGTVPGTVEAMARDAISFIEALGLATIDVVGHSMGGLVAQEVALARPELVRCLVLVGTGPRGGEGVGALPPWVAELFTRKYEQQEDMWLPILFAPTLTSQAAGRAYVARIVARADRDTPVSDQSIVAQRAAIAAYGAAKDPSYAHLKGLQLPVLVVNGTDDIVIPTINSYILQQFLPDAELILYPDANHGSHSSTPSSSSATRASSLTCSTSSLLLIARHRPAEEQRGAQCPLPARARTRPGKARSYRRGQPHCRRRTSCVSSAQLASRKKPSERPMSSSRTRSI
jgi:pimeloyl-ACP methyl ester carboxylesterase